MFRLKVDRESNVNILKLKICILIIALIFLNTSLVRAQYKSNYQNINQEISDICNLKIDKLLNYNEQRLDRIDNSFKCFGIIMIGLTIISTIIIPIIPQYDIFKKRKKLSIQISDLDISNKEWYVKLNEPINNLDTITQIQRARFLMKKYNYMYAKTIANDLEKALNIKHDTESLKIVYAILGEIELKLSRLQESLVYYDKLDDDDLIKIIGKAKIYFKMDMYNESMEMIKKGLSIDECNKELIYMKACIFKEKGNYKKAISLAEKIMDLDRSCPKSYILKANIAQELMLGYNNIPEEFMFKFKMYKYNAEYSLDSSEYKECLSTYKKINIFEAKVMLNEDSYDIEDIIDIMKLDCINAKIYEEYLLGMIQAGYQCIRLYEEISYLYSDTREYEKCEDMCNRAFKLGFESIGLYVSLSYVLLKLGRIKEANDIITQALFKFSSSDIDNRCLPIYKIKADISYELDKNDAKLFYEIVKNYVINYGLITLKHKYYYIESCTELSKISMEYSLEQALIEIENAYREISSIGNINYMNEINLERVREIYNQYSRIYAQQNDYDLSVYYLKKALEISKNDYEANAWLMDKLNLNNEEYHYHTL